MWCNDHVSLVAASDGRNGQGSTKSPSGTTRFQWNSTQKACFIGFYGVFGEAQGALSGKFNSPVQSIFAQLLGEATPYFYRSCNEFLRSPRRCPTPYVRMAL